MKQAVEGHWTSYFYSGAIALILSWVVALGLTGCRIGNKVETGTPSESPISFYATQPQSLAVTSVQAGQSQNAQAPVTNIPTVFSSKFTNPAMLITMDLKTGKSLILAPTLDFQNAQGFPLYLSAQGNISLTGSSTKVAWQTQDCLMQSSLLIEGKTTPLGSTPAVASSSIGNVPLKGRLSVQIKYVTNFQGTCAPSMLAMYQCYQDMTACPVSDTLPPAKVQEIAKGTFDYYIQAGAMTAADIPTTTSLGYTVVYE